MEKWAGSNYLYKVVDKLVEGECGEMCLVGK